MQEVLGAGVRKNDVARLAPTTPIYIVACRHPILAAQYGIVNSVTSTIRFYYKLNICVRLYACRRRREPKITLKLTPQEKRHFIGFLHHDPGRARSARSVYLKRIGRRW